MTNELEEIEYDESQRPSTIIYLIISIFGIAFFLFTNRFIGPKYAEIFQELRVDLPMPTRITLLVVEYAGLVSLGLLLLACTFQIMKNRLFFIILILFLSAFMALEALFIYLPIIKIQEALRQNEHTYKPGSTSNFPR